MRARGCRLRALKISTVSFLPCFLPPASCLLTVQCAFVPSLALASGNQSDGVRREILSGQARRWR